MDLLDLIVVEPDVRFGKPCVRGTRISVGDALGYLAGRMSETETLADFPQLTHDDIRACLAQLLRRHSEDIARFDQQDEATVLELG